MAIGRKTVVTKMQHTDFKQANQTLLPTPGSDHHPLRVAAISYESGEVGAISCWKLSWRDLAKIILTRRIFLGVLGKAQPPVKLSPNLSDFGISDDA